MIDRDAKLTDEQLRVWVETLDETAFITLSDEQGGDIERYLKSNDLRSMARELLSWRVLERAEAERAKPELSDEEAAQVIWAKLCCVQPVGCGDGGTYVVTAPTQSEFVAAVAPALAAARAEAEARIAELEKALEPFIEEDCDCENCNRGRAAIRARSASETGTSK